MLSLRARIFIIVSLIILAVLGVSIFLLVRSKKLATTNNQPNVTENLPANNGLSAVAPIVVADVSNKIQISPVSSEETQKNATEQIAKIFFERFNSYSSESQYQNIRDVQSLISKSYWTQLSAKLPSTKPASNVATPFSSTITKAFSSKLTLWDGKAAVVDLQVKITEEKNNVVTSRDQQAKVYLINEDGNWLVDKFEWAQ